MSEEFREEFAGPESSQKSYKIQCFREGRTIKVREQCKLLDECRSQEVLKKAVKCNVFVKATRSQSLEVVKTGCKIHGVCDFGVTWMPTRTHNGAKRTPSERHINFGRKSKSLVDFGFPWGALSDLQREQMTLCFLASRLHAGPLLPRSHVAFS